MYTVGYLVTLAVLSFRIRKELFSISGADLALFHDYLQSLSGGNIEEALIECLDKELDVSDCEGCEEDVITASSISITDLKLIDENGYTRFTADYSFSDIDCDANAFIQCLQENLEDIGTYELQINDELLKRFHIRNLRIYNPITTIHVV